ncbi:MAG: threonine dehydratase [Candidatus Eremiobacteraeota bacterium]|nr:threonine dehydratase [Candidatus Eremiobacteraeota bacterium]MBV8355090.1 threonine dehydratase [Candidatus Eremiobacteraeota bacterium]
MLTSVLPSLAEVSEAAGIVHSVFGPTPQYAWPLLSQRTGAEVWIKHENVTPVGAFKVRGGLIYLEELARHHPHVKGVITATRGNHGQSIAFAARRHGIAATIVVPHGNSLEKNAAMRALGAELVVHGRDFQEAREHMERLASERELHEIPSFHPWLLRGVATWTLELFEAAPDLDRLYVPIGLGSGICGAIAIRDALGMKTEIVGVVAAGADAYARSFEAGHVVESEANTLADGVAVRIPDPVALDIIRRGAARIVRVSDAEIAAAMRAFFTDTHHVAEGAGAAPLAAAMREHESVKGKKIGLVQTGANIDRELFATVLHASG